MSHLSPRAPSSAFAIRVAQQCHVDEVVEIERRSFTQPWSARSFSGLIGARNALFLVCTDETERVLGYAIVLFAADESELANLAVAEDVRRAGVGRRLLDAATSAAQAHGARKMYLEVRESNTTAKSLYGAVGFQPVARRRRYYEQPVEDALVLRLDFPAPAGAPMGG